jgi:hypothetical protein
MPASISADASMIRFVAEQSLELAQRLTALTVGVGVDEIVEAFGFGEVELAVFERAPGKFAGLGGANMVEPRQRREQRGQHRPAAMDVKLGDILAGRTGRARKPQHHCIVDRLLADIPKQDPGRHPRGRDLAAKGGQHRAGLRTRDPHHGDGARRPA